MSKPTQTELIKALGEAYGWQGMLQSKARGEPYRGEILMAAFKRCVDEGKPIPPELSAHFAACFGEVLDSKPSYLNWPSIFGLAKRSKRGAPPKPLIQKIRDFAVYIFYEEHRQAGKTYDCAVEELSNGTGWYEKKIQRIITKYMKDNSQ